MKNLPEDVKAYKRTPEFTEKTIPSGILNSHRTKEGTWGKIVILEGKYKYEILEPKYEEVELSPDRYGVVEPTIEHQLTPLGSGRFYVEFYKK